MFTTFAEKKKDMEKEFIPYELAFKLKELGFDEECFGFYNNADGNVWIKHLVDDSIKSIYKGDIQAPLWQQAIKFLYLCSNGKINIEINGKDNYEELCKKFDKAIEDFRNL